MHPFCQFKEKSSFKTWLYTIGRNTAIDYLRKTKRQNTISLEQCGELSSEEYELERNYIRQEQIEELYRALGRIKPEYRQILWLTYIEGFSHKETAGIIKKTVHAIDTLVFRAKLALKAEMEKCAEATCQMEKGGFVYEEF